MDDHAYTGVPLIGALLIEEGLITLEQLQVCMLLQSENYLGIPIGQILVNCGYISQSDLNHILILQSEIRSSILQTFDTRIETPTDLTALLVQPHRSHHLMTLLRRYGVASVPVEDWAELAEARKQHQPDLMLIDPALVGPSTDLSPHLGVPCLVLPPDLCGEAYLSGPTWAEQMLEQFVSGVRSRQRHELERVTLQQREFELTALTIMNQMVISTSPAHEAVSQMMLRIRDLLQVEAGVLYRLDRAAGELVSEVVFTPGSKILEQRRVSTQQGIAGWVARFRKPLIVPDVTQDPRFDVEVDQLAGFTTRSVLCTPLIAFGEVRGVIQLMNKLHGDNFTKRDQFLMRIGTVAAALIHALGGLETDEGLSAQK